MLYLVILYIAIIIIFCLFSEKFSDKIGLPTILIFLLLGVFFGKSNIFNFKFIDYEITDNISNIALAFILFYGGFSANIQQAKPILKISLLLSTVGVIFTTTILSILIYFIFKFDILYCFLISSVISSTDAATVFNILKSRKLNLKNNTASLLEVESGSNDPMAYTLTYIFLELIIGNKINIINIFCLQIFIGIGVGFVFSYILINLFKFFKFEQQSSNNILLFAFVLLCYSFCLILNGNGYLSVYILGLIIGNQYFKDKPYIVRFFDSITNISQMLIFFMLGLLFDIDSIKDIFYLSVSIFVLISFVARPISCLILMKPFKCSNKQIIYVSWAGLRGASAICFAIMTTNLSSNYNQIYNIVFFIVILSIFIQGYTLPFLAKKIKFIDNTNNVLKTFNDYQDDNDISFIKVKITKDSYYKDKLIKDINFSGIRIVMIIRKEKNIVPKGNTKIKLNDILILSGDSFVNRNNLSFKEIIISSNDYANKKISKIKFNKNENIVLIKRNKSTLIPNGNLELNQGDIIVMSTF